VANLFFNFKFDDTIFTNQGFLFWFSKVIFSIEIDQDFVFNKQLIEFVLINEMIELLVNVVGYK
jgi:hypothetical protein